MNVEDRDYPPALGGFDRGEHGYRDIGLDERDKNLLPGLKANQSGALHIFPGYTFNVMCIDRLVPPEPGRTLMECRGVVVRGEASEIRQVRIKHHNQLWDFSGANLPEDIEAKNLSGLRWRAGPCDTASLLVTERSSATNPCGIITENGRGS